MSQPADWMELTRLWQAEGAAVSIDELEHHRQRERAAMRALAGVELAGLGLGIVVGIWMSISSPFIWVAGVFIAFCLVMGWVAFRRNHVEPLGGEDLLTSLRIAVAREDWVAAELRFGRALSFVVLFVIVYMASYQMHNFASTSAGAWLALATAAAWICGVLAWNVRLVRRSARRRQRLESYAIRLESNR
jgi:hypothetical protein